MKNCCDLSCIARRRWKKITRVMKLTLTLILFAVLAASAGSTYSQSTRINLKMQDASLVDVFREIERTSEFGFFFKSEEIDLNKRVSIDLQNVSIEQILKKILMDNYDYRILDKNIIVTRGNFNTTEVQVQQGKSVSGKVTDSSGGSLPGVSVVVKGTTTGTITDSNGKYSLSNVPENTILQFSFVGMKAQEIAVGNKAVINVALVEDAIGIEEVVAIGYGTQKKVNLTGAVSSVQGTELQKIPTANLSNVLAGLVPGMTVSQSNGRPGSASSINIRGVGTWNNQSPLYVIDGFVRDKEAFDAIDPNEVETISVLKDAASASIYGSRAANGVILVTTKKGKLQAPEITYKGTYSMESRVNQVELLNGYDAATLYNDYQKIVGTPETSILYFAPDELQYYLDHPELYTNWLEQAWNQPVSQQHNLSVNGGSEKIRYFMSAGYYDGTGFLDVITYKKQNFRANVTTDIAKNLTAEIMLDINNRESNSFNWPNDAGQFDLWNIINGLMIRAPYNRSYVNGLPSVTGSNWHALSALHAGSNNTKNNDYNGIIRLNYNVPFIKGLEVDASYNQTRQNDFAKQFYQHHPDYNFQTSGSHNHLIEDGAALLESRIYKIKPYELIQEDYNRLTTTQFNTSLRYKNSFGKNNVSGVFLYEQTESFADNLMGKGEDFDTHYIEQIDAASSDPARRTATGSGSEFGRMSYIGRINYDYAGKYLLEGSFRYDGSIIFAPENRWGFFPSLSAGWRISEEKFFKDNIDFISNLKLRASSGLVGNDAVTSYQYLQNYNYSGTMYYGTGIKGLALGTFPNPNITWEKSRTNNIGIDAGFLNNSITFSGEYFNRHTYDILRSRILSIPTTFGATLPDENYAEVDVNGLEFTLGYKNKIGEFKYQITGNIGYTKDKVVKLDVAANSRPYQNPIGLPLNSIRGYKSIGILRTQEELDAYKAKVSTVLGKVPELGQLAFQDIRGVTTDEPDGVIDTNDMELLSTNSDPKLNYGLGIETSWRNFNLSMLWQGLGIWDIMLDSKSRSNAVNDNITLYGFWKDHWTPENPNASMPRVGSSLDPTSSQISDFWLESGAFIRLKNLSLSYSLPRAISEKVSAKNINIFFTGTNLLTLTNYKFCDPEQRTLSSYPTMKSITFGLSVTF